MTYYAMIEFDNLERDVRQSDLLSHPFFERFRNGTLTRDQLKLFTSQQYHFSHTFPRCIAGLYAQMPGYSASYPLITHFLSVEPWGNENPQSHSNLFKQWMQTLGLEEHEGDLPLYPETQRFLEQRLDLCTSRDYHVGLGSLAYGHEFVNQFIFAVYLGGLQKMGFPVEQLDYFSAHVHDECADYIILRDMIIATAHNNSHMESVRFGARKTLAERILFLDALDARLQST